MFKFKGLYLSQDDGSSTSATAGQATDNSTGASGKAQDAQSEQNAGKGQDKQGQSKEEKLFSQTEVDNILKDRLAREKKKSEEDADKARKKAEDESLAKNQEFEKLATQRQSEIETLTQQLAEAESIKEQAEKYKAAIETMIKAQTDTLPAAIKELLEKLDPIEKIEYLAKHAKELNIDVKGVPETETGDSSTRLKQAELEKAKNNNAKMVKNFFSR